MSITTLIANLSPEERADHATMLVERICKRESQLPHKERAISCEFLLQVFDELDEAVQVNLANSLARAPAAPPELIVALTKRGRAVSVPILRWSTVVDDQAFLDVINEPRGQRLLAIATRDRLSEPVTQAVLEHATPNVIVALARNSAARFNQASLAGLSWRTIGNPALEEALCIRDELPQDFTQKLMRSVLMRTNIRLATKSHEFDTDTIRLMLRTLEAPSNVEPSDPFEQSEEAAAEIAGLVASGNLTESRLVQFIAAGKIDEIICALASMADLDPALIGRILISENCNTLAVVARSIDLSIKTYRALLAVVCKCEITEAALDRNVATYEEISSLIASRAVTLHRRRRRAAVTRQSERMVSDTLASAPA